MFKLVCGCALIGMMSINVAVAEESTVSDPYQWLEDVGGDRSLDWVREHNAQAESALTQGDDFKALEVGLREVLDSNAKIPYVEKIGEYYYNFWKDQQHERGLWRRTTLAEYRKSAPVWETVLDLDALNKLENENWVWHGVQCLRPANERCLIALSRGGADADVSREFNLRTKQWVEGGFYRSESKGGMGWIDEDSVYIYTDFGNGSMTSSGYPRIVKQWQRGTPLQDAEVVYEGLANDMYIAAMHDATPGFERDFVSRTLAFYNDELYLRTADGELVKIDVPNSANKNVHREWLTVDLREPWTVGGKTYAAGALLVIDFDGFMGGERQFDVLFEPSETTSLASHSWTRSYIVLNVLDDVKNRMNVFTRGDSGWQNVYLSGLPDFGTLQVEAVDAENSDAVWVISTDYLTPTTLYLAESGSSVEKLKTMPAFFDASQEVIEQHFATSKDGTRVPYFMVRSKDLVMDGSAPTLLYGYGGFEISLTPSYSGSLGRGWLSKGGVYVVANIRGGGEYGPRWHQAALKENRLRAYEDFAAVAEDLIARKVTSPAHLGAQGGSNGGLLTGNMLMQYPELFGAVVVQVPLLDMRRYSHLLAGASWMAEYGDPDKPEEWAYIQTFSPYHLFDAQKTYPPVIFLTSTRDDRVHPAHARKMAAKMLAGGKDVTYYENIEGGHGGAANNQQAAHMQALAYTFLWQRLSAQ